jgi:phosphomannomutase/phosphoglucomutase
MEYVKNLFHFKRPLKVVVDSGHGMGGVVAPELFKSMGVDVVELYSNLDPNFPDHHPDPADPKNLVDAQKKVLETQADMGIAYDGDADRIGLLDEKGNNIAEIKSYYSVRVRF